MKYVYSFFLAPLFVFLLAFSVLFPQNTFAESATAACPTPLSTRLVFGIRNSQVLVLQNFLVTQGLLEEENTSGYFGPLTRAAIKIFQNRQGIVSSGTEDTTGFGSTGPLTRAAINKIICGSSNSDNEVSINRNPNPNPNPNQNPNFTSPDSTTSSVGLTYKSIGVNSVQVIWSTSGMTSCTSTDFYVPTSASTSGNATLTLTSPKTFWIYCLNAQGTKSASVYVPVNNGVVTGGAPGAPASPSPYSLPSPTISDSCGSTNQKLCPQIDNTNGCRIGLAPSNSVRTKSWSPVNDGTLICCPGGQINVSGSCKVPTASDLGCTSSQVVTMSPFPQCINPIPTCSAGKELTGKNDSNGITVWSCVSPCPAAIDVDGRIASVIRNQDLSCGNPMWDTSVVIAHDVQDGFMAASYGGGGPGFIVNPGPAIDGYPPTNGSCLSGYSVVSGSIRGGAIGRVCRFSGVPRVAALPSVNINSSWWGGSIANKIKNIDDNYYSMTYPGAFNGGTFTQAGNSKNTIGLMFRYAVAAGLVSDNAAGYGTWSYWCGNSFDATSPQFISTSSGAQSAARKSCLTGIADALDKDNRGLTWSGSTSAEVRARANAQ